jgi:hypothetical protein
MESISIRDRLITAASHYVLDLLEPLSPLWVVGLEIVEDEHNLPECNFDENDLVTILIDHLEDFLLDKWSGGQPFNPSTYTALCVLLSDVEWDVILYELIPQWHYYIECKKEEMAQQRLFQLFADSAATCEF